MALIFKSLGNDGKNILNIRAIYKPEVWLLSLFLIYILPGWLVLIMFWIKILLMKCDFCTLLVVISAMRIFWLLYHSYVFNLL